MTGDGGLVEVQATAERTPLCRAHLDELLALAAHGIEGLREAQAAGHRRVGAVAWRPSCSPPATPTSSASSSACCPACELEPLPDEVELPPETGDTFAANALIKARAAAEATGRPAIADDSGIEAEALGGAPGVRSARYAGEHATDAENLDKLRAEAPPGTGLRYVCVVAYVEPGEAPRTVRGHLRGPHGRRSRAATAASATTPSSSPPTATARRTMAELSDEEKDAISHRGRAAREAAAWLRRAADATAPGSRSRAARRSRSPPTPALILLKIVAGAVTGSVAIITEAIHSAIDLIASIVAFFSVRQAETPADAAHRYGHEKFENVAAGVEGDADPRRLRRDRLHRGQPPRRGHRDRVARLRHRGRRASPPRSTSSSRSTSTGAPARPTRPPSPATPPTCAPTPTRRSACSSASALVQLTGATWIDPVVALLIAVAIVVTGLRIVAGSWRVLVDEALPEDETEAIREAIESFGARGVVGYHELRTRRAGARRYVDLHVQFRSGTTLEDAHATAHELQDAIRGSLRGADVLIHLEPEDRVRPGRGASARGAAGRARRAQRRLIAAASATASRRRRSRGSRSAGAARVIRQMATVASHAIRDSGIGGYPRARA